MMKRIMLALALTFSLALTMAVSQPAEAALTCGAVAGAIEYSAAVNADISEPRADWLEVQIAGCGGASFVAGLSVQAQAWLTAEGVSY